MNTFKLIDSIIHLTWMGVFAMILLLGTTLFSNFTIKETEPEAVLIDGPFFPVDENIALGKTLFRKNCASCHNKDMKSDLTGPALSGVTERWGAYPKEDLYSWIRNSSKLISKKHPKALEIWNEWDKDTMTSFNELTDEEIEAILSYIEVKYF